MKLIRNHLTHDNSGFTLVEVLAASAILVVGVLANMSIGGNIFNRLGNDRRRAMAIQIQNNFMEDLIQRYPTNSYLTPGSHFLYFDVGGNLVPDATNSMFVVTWQVTLNSPATGVLSIEETTSWSFSGLVSKISLLTYRSTN